LNSPYYLYIPSNNNSPCYYYQPNNLLYNIPQNYNNSTMNNINLNDKINNNSNYQEKIYYLNINNLKIII